jgi:hypothetical protein
VAAGAESESRNRLAQGHLGPPFRDCGFEMVSNLLIFHCIVSWYVSDSVTLQNTLEPVLCCRSVTGGTQQHHIRARGWSSVSLYFPLGSLWSPSTSRSVASTVSQSYALQKPWLPLGSGSPKHEEDHRAGSQSYPGYEIQQLSSSRPTACVELCT